MSQRRSMTPEELERFEKEIVQGEPENVAIPASESELLSDRDEHDQPLSPATIIAPD